MVSRSVTRAAVVMLAALSTSLAAVGQQYTFTHFAGSTGGGAYLDASSNVAHFSSPKGCAWRAGDLFIADSADHVIRRLSSGGEVSTFAGTGEHAGWRDGRAPLFNSPAAVAFDSAGNLFVADAGNYVIRKISAAGGTMTFAGLAGTSGTADGTGSTARFSGMTAIAVDSADNVYVADSSRIRKITPAAVVTTLAGSIYSGFADASGVSARFSPPLGITVDLSGNLYVADQGNRRIRLVSPSGTVTTVAGSGASGFTDGSGTAASFYRPRSIVVNASGDLLIADNGVIRLMTPAGVVTTVAGSMTTGGSADGHGTSALFSIPQGFAMNGAGDAFITDSYVHVVRRMTPTFDVTTVAGQPAMGGSVDGNATSARFGFVYGLKLSTSGALYVVDSAATIRTIASNGDVTTLTSNASGKGTDVVSDDAGTYYYVDQYNNSVKKFSGGTMTLFAGSGSPSASGSADGNGTAARFYNPTAIARDSSGNLYVSDRDNHTIRKITSGGAVTTWAGAASVSGSADGTLTAARFKQPDGLAFDAAGTLYVADTGNCTIRKITTSGDVTTIGGVAGSCSVTDGSASVGRFLSPSRIAVAVDGSLFVSESGVQVIRRLTSAGDITTIAGTPSLPGAADGTGGYSLFNSPSGIAVTSDGTVYVGELLNYDIRRGVPTIDDVATVDRTTGAVFQLRQLGVSPATATSFSWTLLGRPLGSTAALSSTTIANPTFTPDVAGAYVVRLMATSALGARVSNVEIYAGTAYQLTVAKSGSGSGTVTSTPSGIFCGSTCTNLFDPGAVVTLSTVPAAGAQFAGWSGDPDCADGTLTMDASKNCTATFNACTLPPPPITVPAAVCGSTTNVASVPDQGTSATYNWSISGGTIAAGAGTRSILFKANSSGSVALSVLVGTDVGCAYSSTSVTINPVPGAVISLNPYLAACSGTPITATVSDAGAGATYSWDVIGGTITGGGGTRSITFTAGDHGARVSVTVTRPTGCSATGSVSTNSALSGPLYSGVGSPPSSTWSALTGLTVSDRLFDAAGGNGTIFVTSQCPLQPVSSAGWLTIGNPVTDQNGSSRYPFTVAPNVVSAPRSALVTVGGADVWLSQRGTTDDDSSSLRLQTVAGMPDRLGTGWVDAQGYAARFALPAGTVTDAAGNIYVADYYNHVIRKVDVNRNVTTFAGRPGAAGYRDGSASEARFNQPAHLAIDAAGNLYVSEGDTGLSGIANHVIRRIAPDGTVSTFAGRPGLAGHSDGPRLSAIFNDPQGLAFDASGNLLVADSLNSMIRRITPAGDVTTLAGTGLWDTVDGPVASAQFQQPVGVAVDPAGNVYVVDVSARLVRKITPAGQVSTFAGTLSSNVAVDGLGTAASFSFPWDIAADAAGNLYVADSRLVRKITPGADVTTFAGGNATPADGTGTGAGLLGVNYLSVAPNGTVVITDGRVRTISPDRAVTTIAGPNPAVSTPPLEGSGSEVSVAAADLAVDASGNAYTCGTSYIRKVTPSGGVTIFAGSSTEVVVTDGPIASARFASISTIAGDGAGTIYVADSGTVRKISGSQVTTIAGAAGRTASIDGEGTTAYFNAINALAADVAGNVYVAQSSCVRRISPSGTVTTFSGNCTASGVRDGSASDARFWSISGIAVTSSGTVYVIDASYPSAVTFGLRRIAADGTVTTVAGLPGKGGNADGAGSAVRFMAPRQIAVDAAGNLYLVDPRATTIRKVTPSGVVTTVAGLPVNYGAVDGKGSAIRLSSPTGVAIDSSGYLWVNDGLMRRSVGALPSCTPLASASASLSGASAVCANTTGGTAAATWSNGGAVVFQWGWRSTTGGTITNVPGATSPSYTIQGTDFGGGGTRYLVATVTPECGSPITTNEIPLTITAVLSGTSISSTGTTTIAPAGTGGTVNLTESGGGSVTHRWGYRTVSGGAVTTIAGKTGTSYALAGADFPGSGTYFLVATSTPSCGDVITSNEITVYVNGTNVPINLAANPVSPTSISVSWTAVSGAGSYEILRRTIGGTLALIGNSATASFTDTVAANTPYLYVVRVVGGANSAPAYAGTFSFSDRPFAPGITPIRALHIAELRSAVNAMRALAGIANMSFTDTIDATTPIRAIHLRELRTAVTDARSALGIPGVSFTDPDIIAGVTASRAVHLTEIQNAVRQ